MTVFVILHYLSYEMTQECVDRLRKTFQNQTYQVVIVDNGSGNGSGERLQERYQGQKNCHVLMGKENLGFARGNNLGYRYAREHLKPDYVVVMNNDVLIEDPKFLEQIEKLQKETDFDVLGPDVVNKIGEHQSPMQEKGYTLEEIEALVKFRENKLKHFAWYYYPYWVRCSISFYRKRKKHLPLRPENKLSKSRQKQVVLHGSCVIFSRRYIQQEEDAFCPETFLYLEEDILHYLCQRKGYKMVYDPSVKVRHLEDVSTDMAYHSNCRKEKMHFERFVESGYVLIRMMKQDIGKEKK